MPCRDILVNCAGGVGANCVSGVVKEARYCYRFDTLVTELGDEQENLKSTIESVQDLDIKARANTHELSGGHRQLGKAKDLIDKVEKLKTKAKASKSCCHGVCPNWICRYIVGWKAAKTTEAIKQLNGKLGEKLPFAQRLPLQPPPPSKDFILFESTRAAFDKILMALKDDNKMRIGLYGMGGCGKSSLLEEVHREVTKDSTLFYKTIPAVVSKTPDISAIQDSIATWLGLTFETEKNVPDRAARLSMAFEEDKKYLIILDDVWEVLRFDKIGIPFRKNCKVLLSTRQQNICNSMDCQEVIPLSLLTKGEVWNLFQKHAGEIKDTLKKEAREISDECHKLPVAIKAVASTLKGKSPSVWKDALETLKDRRPIDIEKGLENPYECLKFSYDELKDKERSLFLLCALFPKDSKVSREILIRFAFGLDIFEDVDSYEKVRCKVVAAIDKIKDCSLLLQSEKEEDVEMHDLVRAVALWAANKKTQVIMGPKRNLKALTERDYMKDTTRLYCHNIKKFPDQLNCPKLEILFVWNYSIFGTKLPDTLFKEMIELKVLVLVNDRLSFLRWMGSRRLLLQSIDGLKKLRTLCLRGFRLDNISILGKLEKLDTIELFCCEIKELPKELAELRRLKLLEVSGCRIKSNPFEVLARCSQLEELYLVKSYFPGMVSNDQHVVKLFHQIRTSKVKRYHLQIGRLTNTLKDNLTSRFISINNFNLSISNEAIKDLAQKLEVLFLKKIQGDCKNIIPDMIPTNGECMNELTEFLLQDSDNIEYLIDATNQLDQVITVFFKLLKLKIETMKCLKALCRGPPPSCLFEKLEELFIMECSQLHCIVSEGKLNLCSLKYLKLEDCPKLTFVFTSSTAQTLVLLEVLEVRDCAELKHIIKDEEEDNTLSVGPVFPKLRKASVKRCENLECIIPASFAGDLSQLESLEIEGAHELKHVFGKCNHEEDQNHNLSIDLPVLKALELSDLPNIISICPQNYRITWPSLDGLQMRGCPQLSGMSDLDSEVREQGGDKATKQEELGLPARLSSQMIGQSVKDIHVEECKMEGIFQFAEPAINTESNSEPKGLPQEYERPEEEEEHLHGNDGEDKDEREEEKQQQQHKEEEYAIPEDNGNVIEQGCAESREVDEAVVGNPSVGNYSLPSTTISGTGQVDAIHQDKKEVPPHTVLTYTNEGRGFATVTSTIQDDNPNEVNQRNNNDIPSGFDLNKETDLHHEIQATAESNPEIAKGSLHKDPAPEESEVGTSSRELSEKLPKVEVKPPRVVTEPQQALQEYKVSPPLPMHPTILSSSTSITTTPPTTEALTSPSTKQNPLGEELADFHGLFKIKARRARLLDEAFVKYPHLWEWKLSQKTLGLCKVGYKLLADMLAFLKSETPKAMDDSKRKKFEDLCAELEYFGFDREWLASIRQRVMEMQVDQNDKLKQLVQLESEVSTLEGQLNVARARMATLEVQLNVGRERMATIKDDLSKFDNVFDL